MRILHVSSTSTLSGANRYCFDLAAGQIFLPCPFVFQRQQLVDVGAAIDHALVVHLHTLRRFFQFLQPDVDVERFQSLNGSLHRVCGDGCLWAGRRRGNDFWCQRSGRPVNARCCY